MRITPALPARQGAAAAAFSDATRAVAAAAAFSVATRAVAAAAAATAAAAFSVSTRAVAAAAAAAAVAARLLHVPRGQSRLLELQQVPRDVLYAVLLWRWQRGCDNSWLLVGMRITPALSTRQGAAAAAFSNATRAVAAAANLAGSLHVPSGHARRLGRCLQQVPRGVL